MSVERLLPAVRHSDGSARGQGEQAGVYVDIEVLLAAERTADAGQHESHLVEGESEAGGHLGLVEVEVLARHVELHAAVAVGNGLAGLGSEEGRVLGAELVVADDDHLGFSTGGVDIAVADLNVADETAAGKSIDGTGQ